MEEETIAMASAATTNTNLIPVQETQLDLTLNSKTSAGQAENNPQDIQERDKQTTPAEKIVANVEDDDDDYDEDDDEEKENSQKLVIDISDDDDEAGEEDEEKSMDRNGEVAIELAQNKDKNADEKALLEQLETAKTTSSLQIKENESIIILSDAEEDTASADAVAKPGKIQKRKSAGAPFGTTEEETFRLKRRKINVEGAPKLPLTGYVRYMNSRRESARKEYPNKTSMEITKQIGEEWQGLASDIKSKYLDAAEEDKKRYTSELQTFLKSRPDVLASELAKNKMRRNDNNSTINGSNNPKIPPKEKPQIVENPKNYKEGIKEKIVKDSIPVAVISQASEKQQTNEKPKHKRTPTPPSTSASSSVSVSATAAQVTSSALPAVPPNIVTPTNGEIPIFTNEFLEHNKIYDMELRSLRKSKIDLEQQNYVLEKHVENMKCGVEKMVSENNEIEEKNMLLEIYLDKLKRKLTNAFAALPLPSSPNGATMENIDKYMQDLYKMSTSNSHGPATLNKAKDIIRKLDLQIQL